MIEDIDQPTDFRQEPQDEIREDTESDVEEDFEENWQAAAEKNLKDIHHNDIVKNPELEEDEDKVQHIAFTSDIDEEDKEHAININSNVDEEDENPDSEI